ncbi:MAG: hypothetical protein LBS09_06390 [Bacteroidales bacterium]|jgi:hypothetical protein|nr:hypothetical protein [Bacteroidales bacterium]
MSNIRNKLYEKFLEAIRSKVPERFRLANIIADVLLIEKDAVYRRLRGEVPFTFAEAATVAERLDISLDDIIFVASPYRSRPFHLHLQNYFEMEEIDYTMSQNYVETIRSMRHQNKTVFGCVTNVLPLHVLTYCPLLFRLYLLKWMYQFRNFKAIQPFSQIFVPERLQKLHRQYLEEVQNIKHTFFIWDKSFLAYMVHDIKYFQHLRLIADEDMLMLKNETEHFLSKAEEVTSNGGYSNGNKVDIYISGLNLDATYSYLTNERDIHISMVNAFTLGALTSMTDDVCERMKVWMTSIKRSSILISASSEKERISFFDKQRELLHQQLIS